MDLSITDSYLKEIKILKDETNKKEALIKELIEIIRNLTTYNLKQQPIQSQSFTYDSDKNNCISTARPKEKEINVDNTNMNTSTIKDDFCDKSTDIVTKKATIIQYWIN